ncbi:sulfurtransferase TusA family protein [Romboutsia sp. 1001216sp1]|uniref:sulfurtransferase TusA family protein n=1 Tax=unclassified Romboutsia TaxID=2626894 RepID=UPI0018A8F822|nr:MULTISPECIES: sulfurtransferase TusA family protein [unclassified Romboutsia]MDB8793092.1 sulfurtransferase TusA family protein [Romboutsia sp. 1001216sp1]MDB8795885.1 sulfurtransferase TusA family protein [Romboutsia sp. 1001216sp1]MDB8799380.1 sulfurtransferase TusA family protein [Romboutsia sp. 1001216sp1]
MLVLAKKIDARGYSCLQPVLMAKKGLEENPQGVEVLVDNNAACQNIKSLLILALLNFLDF